MNRIGMALAAWVFLALDVGLAKPLLELGTTRVAPSFVLVLAMYVGMVGSARVAGWTALVLGLLVDLTAEVALTTPGGRVFVPGPHAMAFWVGVQLVLSMRGVMIRRNPLTLGFLTMCGGLVAQVILTGCYWVRSLYDPVAMDQTAWLLAGLGGAVYSGVVAVPLALVLLPMAPALGLPSQQPRRFGRS